MTTMPAEPLAVDSLLSFARLEGDTVRLVLALPRDSGIDGPRVFVRFQNGPHGFRMPAFLVRSAERVRVEVSVPRAQIADGIWRLRLREGASTPRILPARLLLHGDQPVALLFGKTANIT